jgi:hypothetical protein
LTNRFPILRFPPENKDIDAEIKKLRNLSLDEGEPKQHAKEFQYPPNILASIEVVMAGLPYLYTDMPHQIPRIKWAETDPSVESFPESSNRDLPTFHVERKPHAAGLPRMNHVPYLFYSWQLTRSSSLASMPRQKGKMLRRERICVAQSIFGNSDVDGRESSTGGRPPDVES